MEDNSSTFGTAISYSIAFLVVISIIRIMIYMILKKEEVQENEQQLHIAEEPPVTRLDILSEEELEQWQCGLCEFLNTSEKQACVLCGMAKDTQPCQSSRRIVRLNDLTLHQKGAKKRKDWERKLGLDGKYYWQRREIQTSRNSIGLVSQFVRKSDVETSDPFERNPHQRLTFVASDNVTIAPGERDDISLLSFGKKYAWFMKQLDSLLQPWTEGRLKFRVHRSTVVVETMEQLLGTESQHLHLPLRIEFVGEEAIDAGGLAREWIVLICEKVFDTELGLFKEYQHDIRGVGINPSSQYSTTDHLLYYRGIGRFVGRVLLEGHLLPTRFCLPLMKHILGSPLTFSDLEFLDAEVYRSMEWLRAQTDAAIIEALALDFTVVQDILETGEVEEIELKPNGKHTPVTLANKDEYLQLKWEYLMLKGFAPQLQSFLGGIFDIIPQELLSIFDYQEFELVLCGRREIDVDDWKQYTQVSESLVDSDVLTWFWETVNELSQEEKERLLQYTTGSSQVPVQGFKGLTSYDGRICYFTLKACSYTSLAYPRVHTCFNRIDFPLYHTKAEVRRAILSMTRMETTGFTQE